MERQYDKVHRLMTESARNLADLNDILRSPVEEDISDEEKRALELAFIKLIVVMKEFNNGR